MQFEHSFYQLGLDFFQEISPDPVKEPELFLWNTDLQERLGLPSEFRLKASQYLSGNQLPEGTLPIALAYAGHQFGSYNPQLGDGRAHLLGELKLDDERLFDLQLKGSGRTRYSRRGDGRCAMGPAIREYLMSEAMHALGVPTSRTLAVVKTGETVYRSLPEPGAIVARAADSHIRVGTFQYHSMSGKRENLIRLIDYTIARHFPEIDLNAPDKAMHFLKAVNEKQIELIVEWMRIGFIHGVMNTDNTAISGETIDYGPCAMIGIYDPRTTYSSIDTGGRYCFGNQPSIMQWNMTRLAESLLPLIDADEHKAIEKVEPLIEEITERCLNRYYSMMADKLGLSEPDKALTDALLSVMEEDELDYTQTFIDLMEWVEHGSEPEQGTELSQWYQKWITLLDGRALEKMKAVNPLVIPRNHHVEEVIAQCIEHDDPGYAKEFLSVLKQPYTKSERIAQYQDLPIDGDRNYQTFCGT